MSSGWPRGFLFVREDIMKRTETKGGFPSKRTRLIRDYALMFAGATLTAVAAKYIFDPAGLVTGGATGLAIIIRSLSQRYLDQTIPLWFSNLVINLPIFLYAAKVSGLRNVFRTGLVIAVMSAELYVLPEVAFMPDDKLLTALFGSILVGVGSGLLLTAHATSGGSDMLGEAMHHHFRSVSVGRLIQIIDGLIVVGGLLTFGVENTLYAIIAVYMMGRIVDLILSQGKRARTAYIISENSEPIAEAIMTRLDRGVTGLKGRGMFTGEDKCVLMCVCSNRELVDIKDIVGEMDPRAFIILGEASEVRGEGFVME